MEGVPAKLKRLRNAANPTLTVRKMAELLDVEPSSYAYYEDAKKFKKPILPFDLAKRISAILGERGVDPAEVMTLAGLSASARGLNSSADATAWETLDVIGTVAAGVWRQQSDIPRDEGLTMKVGPNPFPGTDRFALKLEGMSMNKTILPNSLLECRRIPFGAAELRPGDLVIVQRNNHDLTELTCKRLDVDGEDWILRCESYEPEFQDVIHIGRPSEDVFVDNEIAVIGVVLSARQDFVGGRW